MREHLLTGHDWPFLDGPQLDEDELQAAWEELKGELLTGHIAEHRGSRPWAWWKWDAPEPRRQINPGPEVIDRGEGEPYFGMPRCYAGVPPSNMFESEAEFLDRLGLLSSEERRALEEVPLAILPENPASRHTVWSCARQLFDPAPGAKESSGRYITFPAR